MSTDNPDSDDAGAPGGPGAAAGDPQTDREADLAAQLDLLEAENERLRREYRRATQTTYRKTAFALVALGVLALGGAAAFPAAATVFVALAGVGCFGGVLTYYLTPERVLTASVGQHVFDAARTNAGRVADELGLQDAAVFLPDDSDGRVFRPQHPEYVVPDDPDRVFVVSEDPREQGVALATAGGGLFAEFEAGLAGSFADDVATAADQLGEAVVEQFELAASVSADGAAADGRVVFGVTDPAITPVDAADHPVAAFLGTGLATHRGRPVEVAVRDGDERYDARVVVTWPERED